MPSASAITAHRSAKRFFSLSCTSRRKSLMASLLDGPDMRYLFLSLLARSSYHHRRKNFAHIFHFFQVPQAIQQHSRLFRAECTVCLCEEFLFDFVVAQR